ncbi:prostate stem cell antigen [Hemicordylus capensis]|uniref:prostate stem cell antigen n=1 Tax=Hemicordylus capensis TaxID=884348 RepID=UPI0023041247|nr:prostate stem cell antigen [Hemicordylus capensis]XP_053104959.1 prostate stem cell antigen [Hemicordylus capensis]XP_053104960.1 prostate stem cell antigen [Hemicordylus capensis]XP_053104961.1 prostate stem cell antigen [Hemicordylus capensis]
MKPLLIFVLAGSLFMHPAGSLKCYTCSMKLKNNDCQLQETCKAGANICKTEVIGAAGLFNLISKECTSSCEPYFKDFTVGKRNITCCTSELCNVNGASGIRMSYILPVALAVVASFASAFLRSGL